MTNTAKNKIVTVDIVIHHPEWNDCGFSPQRLARKIIPLALSMATLPAKIRNKKLNVSTVFTDNGEVQTLNRHYRKKNKPTNVLSFPDLSTADSGGKTVILGDIVLAYETIAREALEERKSLKNHVTHLLIHGTLHLLGYDHMNDRDASRMERLEIKILENLKIKNPYA